MSRFLAALLALALAVAFHSPALADDKEKEKDKPKPNTLTPKEIAEGWILLFDGESTFGWKINGAAEVKDGVLILGKGKKTTIKPTTNFGTDYFLELDFQGHCVLQVGSELIEITAQDGRWGHVFCGRPVPTTAEPFFTMKDAMVKKPDSLGGKLVGTPCALHTDGKSDVSLRSVKLRPLNTKLLFTGKNLGGWKVNGAEPKRMASKWTVTKDGELSVKNGPGDLVSERQFDDFVLQFECKTNGKALNSGVFFRCIPGQYQNGYEAQIQNAYKDNDRTKPADFGTGAIYRRVPARRVVSNDNEWFTMTVVANGRRISTWVNGYQTVDWTDDRKEDENPRKGFRAAKGPISLQGHDPTTDILFRNVRIAELPSK